MNSQSAAAEVLSVPVVIPSQATEVADRDVMPYEVATARLTDPRARLTGKDRRMYQRSREVHRMATRLPKTREERAEKKMRSATWAQLLKWTRRLTCARQRLQHLFLRIQDLQGPKWDALREQINGRVELIELTSDACTSEIEARKEKTDKTFRLEPKVFVVAPEAIALAERIIAENKK